MISGNTIVAPVTTTDVRNLTGCPSNSVNYLITAAKSGGVNGRAFNTTQGGGNAYLGELIEGALPYWNIFSNESPGEWTVGIGDLNPLIFRLKRDKGGTRYAPMLGAFRNYKHNSVGPTDNDIDVRIPVSGSKVQNLGIRYKTGEYDWRKLSGNANAAQVAIYNSGGLQIAVSEVMSLTNVNMLLVTNVIINLNSTSFEHVETYTMRMFIGRKVAINDFSIYGYIPIDSIITFTIYKEKPLVYLNVTLTNTTNNFKLQDAFITGANSWIFTGVCQITKNEFIPLKSITYSTVNEAGDIGSTVTVTSYNLYESPTTVEIFKDVGPTLYQDFSVSRSRVTPNASYPFVQITMIYSKT